MQAWREDASQKSAGKLRSVSGFKHGGSQGTVSQSAQSLARFTDSGTPATPSSAAGHVRPDGWIESPSRAGTAQPQGAAHIEYQGTGQFEAGTIRSASGRTIIPASAPVPQAAPVAYQGSGRSEAGTLRSEAGTLRSAGGRAIIPTAAAGYSQRSTPGMAIPAATVVSARAAPAAGAPSEAGSRSSHRSSRTAKAVSEVSANGTVLVGFNDGRGPRCAQLESAPQATMQQQLPAAQLAQGYQQAPLTRQVLGIQQGPPPAYQARAASHAGTQTSQRTRGRRV